MGTAHATKTDRKLKGKKGGGVVDKTKFKDNALASLSSCTGISASARLGGYRAAEITATLPSSNITDGWP